MPAPYWPLIALVVAGVLLRLYTMVVYSTVVTDYFTGDAGRFLRIGYEGLFYDEWQPAGYPSFLIAVRAVFDDLDVTIALQHAFGVATALVLYATTRRAGASRAWSLLPAGLVLLSGDHLFLEHAILTESLWLLVLAAATYAAVRGGLERHVRWIALSSLLLGLSAIVRNGSLLLPLVLIAWALWTVARSRRGAGRTAAAALGPAVAVVLGYSLLASALGPYSGLGEMSGWSLYARVGQFADCRQFDPPKGSEVLCEDRPPGERPGAFYYYFGGPDIPARALSPGMRPEDGDLPGEFARAAILGQPLDYVRTVSKDVVRFFDAQAGYDRELSGSGPEAMSFRRMSPDPANSAAYAQRIETQYSDLDESPGGGTGLLETYQRVFRLNGLLLAALFALPFAGLLRGRGRAQRQVAVLCVVVASFLLVLPPAVSAFEARYAIPPAMFLAVAAALAGSSLSRRRTEARPAAPQVAHLAQ